MIIPQTFWTRYIQRLRAVNDAAAEKMLAYLQAHPPDTPAALRDLLDYAYGIATAYGEAAAELACEMYDAVGVASDVILPAAEPALTPAYGEVAKTVNGTLKTGNANIVSEAIGRLVKQTGVDTTMQNAIRDGAEWAWVPSGDTCPFCLTLASRGWQRASKAALKGGHAEHIHANCDCTYAIRHDSRTTVAGYDPEKYLYMYDHAPLDEWNTPDGKPPKGDERAERDTPQNRINAMRRELYADEKDRINAQKRAAYAARKEREAEP